MESLMASVLSRNSHANIQKMHYAGEDNPYGYLKNMTHLNDFFSFCLVEGLKVW